MLGSTHSEKAVGSGRHLREFLGEGRLKGTTSVSRHQRGILITALSPKLSRDELGKWQSSEIANPLLLYRGKQTTTRKKGENKKWIYSTSGGVFTLSRQEAT